MWIYLLILLAVEFIYGIISICKYNNIRKKQENSAVVQGIITSVAPLKNNKNLLRIDYEYTVPGNEGKEVLHIQDVTQCSPKQTFQEGDTINVYYDQNRPYINFCDVDVRMKKVTIRDAFVGLAVIAVVFLIVLV